MSLYWPLSLDSAPLIHQTLMHFQKRLNGGRKKTTIKREELKFIPTSFQLHSNYQESPRLKFMTEIDHWPIKREP